MQRSGSLYTLGFAAVVCLVCSVLVSFSSVALKRPQQINMAAARQRQVLSVAGLIKPGEKLSNNDVAKRFEENIHPRIVDLATGSFADDQVSQPYDPIRAMKEPGMGVIAPANPAGVELMPKYGVVHEVLQNGARSMVILQVWGRGLWSTMYGYLALDNDGNTIRGLTFYEHGETPGLGGEVDNPRWKAAWPGRRVFDTNNRPSLVMRKGGAGAPDQDPHGFDGLSGATITSKGVEHLLNFWLGEAGYGPFLAQLKANP